LAVILTVVVSIIFAAMAFSFFMYDRFVHRRNRKIVGAAANSNAFISTLFPSQVKKRLLEENDEMQDASTKPQKSGQALRFQLGDEANDDEGGESKPLVAYSSKPIADLFTETTILFADIAGFSAWSSVREPSQVFVLLETLFRAFDEIAKKRRVFKVSCVA
jgi:Adenylate and Guanylate cyclase catalytic domain